MSKRAVATVESRYDVSLTSLDEAVAFHLRRAQEASFLAFVQRTGDYDLSPGQYALLTLIRDNPGASQAALGEAMNRDRSTMTATLRKLEAKGHVSRSPSVTDRRAFRIDLTKAGRAELSNLSASARAHDRLIDKIVGDDKARLIKILERLTDALSEQAHLV